MTCFDHYILLHAGALLARPHGVLGFGFRALGSVSAASSLANTAALFPELQRVSKKMPMQTWTRMRMRVSMQCFAVGRLEGYKMVAELEEWEWDNKSCRKHGIPWGWDCNGSGTASVVNGLTGEW